MTSIFSSAWEKTWPLIGYMTTQACATKWWSFHSALEIAGVIAMVKLTRETSMCWKKFSCQRRVVCLRNLWTLRGSCPLVCPAVEKGLHLRWTLLLKMSKVKRCESECNKCALLICIDYTIFCHIGLPRSPHYTLFNANTISLFFLLLLDAVQNV